MSVKLRNLTRRQLTVLVEHGDSARVPVNFTATQHNAKTGEVTRKRHYLSVPRSITLLAGETREGLPEWVAACPDVRRKKLQGALMVDRIPEVTTAAPGRAVVRKDEAEPAPEPEREVTSTKRRKA